MYIQSDIRHSLPRGVYFPNPLAPTLFATPNLCIHKLSNQSRTSPKYNLTRTYNSQNRPHTPLHCAFPWSSTRPFCFLHSAEFPIMNVNDSPRPYVACMTATFPFKPPTCISSNPSKPCMERSSSPQPTLKHKVLPRTNGVRLYFLRALLRRI